MKWIFGVCLFSSTLIAAPTAPPDGEEAAYPAIERFVQVLESVRKLHPDVDRLTYDRLVNHALEGMMASLDPHSSFIHPEMAAMLKENAKLNPDIPSLGLSLAVRDTGIYVMSVSPPGAAGKAGVIPGSAVLEIDGKSTEDADFPATLESLKRPPGEKTKFLLKSPEAPKPIEITLTHRLVDERSVTKSEVIDPAKGIGYVRLATFGSTCAREMEAGLDELEDGGMKSLILDLRGNGGGDLYQTVAILGLFLPPGTTVVTTRGREGDEPPLKTAERQRRKRDYPITVLIDNGSASASELTAGALQDLKRATIIGELSYGKGSVQRIVPMGGGTALRVTVATYHTPSGRTPHRIGITPDVVVKLEDSDRENFEKRQRIDSLGPDEKKAVDAWKDAVLEQALKQLPATK